MGYGRLQNSGIGRIDAQFFFCCFQSQIDEPKHILQLLGFITFSRACIEVDVMGTGLILTADLLLYRFAVSGKNGGFNGFSRGVDFFSDYDHGTPFMCSLV